MINTNTIYEGKSTSGKGLCFDYFKKLLCTQHQCAFCKEHHIDTDTVLGCTSMGLSGKIHTAMNLHTKNRLDSACCMWLASSPSNIGFASSKH